MPEDNHEHQEFAASIRKLVDASIPADWSDDLKKLPSLVDLSSASTQSVRDTLELCGGKMARVLSHGVRLG